MTIAEFSDMLKGRCARCVVSGSVREAAVNRYVFLYLATLIVFIPIDLLFLGLVARSFFASQVGDMLGEIRPAPAALFYLLYVAGILIFVSGPAAATWQSTLLYGALFGFFCYATFELTSLSLLKHWTWPVVAVDMSWGTFVTAVAATLGLLIADWIVPKVSACHSGMVSQASDPESRDSGFDAAHRPGMTVSIARNRDRHFGCGTIRMYGFGDFQPCG
jgi:uncharacterized membrane protein